LFASTPRRCEFKLHCDQSDDSQWEKAPTTLCESTICSHLNTKYVKKWSGGCVLHNVSTIHEISSIFVQFQLFQQWKTMKETTLNLSLHLGCKNYNLPFGFHFLVWTNWISSLPPKIVPCKCHLKLGWIGLGSLSKGIGSHLWDSIIYRIASFCWTLPSSSLRPSSKVPPSNSQNLINIIMVQQHHHQ
jgi:hypothetical protein